MSPIQRALPALALMLLAACGHEVSLSATPVAQAAPPSTAAIDMAPEPEVLAIEAPAVVQDVQRATADRGVFIEITTTTTATTVPTGINGLPFAPPGMEACDEMMFYATQFGMPERFRGIGWRESNCRNEDGVKTFCCHGYWQLYVSLHLKDHRLVDGYHACGVYSKDDVNSATPQERQRQACAASVLYRVMGTDPWAATR